MGGERLPSSLGIVVVVVACFCFQGRALEGASFIRGDADGSGRLEITDGIRVLGYLFLGSPASLDCEEAADVDASGAIDISDAAYLLNFLFGGGAAPGAPFPDCGPSPAPGGLGCAAYPECGNVPPQASFTYSPQRGRAPLEVTFDGSASTDPEGAIAAYAWSLGDGDTAEGPRVNHLYDSPGSYTVTLTVTDAEGAPATVTAVVVVDGETEPTSFELIDRALAAGEIDAETALIYRVFHVFEDERLPGAFHGGVDTLPDTHIIADVIERYDQISDAGRAVLAPFLIPPAAEGSWLEQRQDGGGGGVIQWETVVSPSGRVKVWSQTRYPGDNVTAATIAGAVDGIWNQLAGLMEREPLSDGDVGDPNGGDPKFDVYMVRMQSASGETHVYQTGFSCSNPNPVYVLIDGRESDCLLATVAHEIMHAIQWSYVGNSGCLIGLNYRWWMEASATWAEEYVFRRDKNECQADKAFSFLRQPEEPLEFSGRPHDPFHIHPYGAYLWPYYLERSSGSPDYVRTIWENCTQFHSALRAIDESLPEGFRKWWPEFALYNWNDHPEFNYDHDGFVMSAFRAEPATGKPHPHGESFTEVKLNGQPDVKIPLFAKIQHLSSIYYHFTFPDEDVRYVVFEHFFDVNAHPTARVQAMIKKEGDLEYTYEDWTETPRKAYSSDQAGQRLSDLVIILTNSEWRPLSEDLTPAKDPVLLARGYLSGAWSGILTHVRTHEEDSETGDDRSGTTTRTRWRWEQRWEIIPRVIGRYEFGAAVYEATWVGSGSVNNYYEIRGQCGLTVGTTVDQHEGPRMPSAFAFFPLPGRRSYQVLRESPSSTVGAPPIGSTSMPARTRTVDCLGGEINSVGLATIRITEAWGIGSPFLLELTDPSKPETFKGEKTNKQELPFFRGVVIITNTWTWDLTREPD